MIKIMFMFKIKNNSGFSMILVVIIIGVSSLIMAKSAVFLGLGELDASSAAAAGDKAYYLAESCVEDALLRLKMDDSYLADGKELFFADGLCRYDVAEGGVITAVSESNGFIRTIRAQVTASSSEVVVETYGEVGD
jgi:hypothetical protein